MPQWQKTFVTMGMLACSLTGIAYLLGQEFQIQTRILGTHRILAAHGITAMLASLALGSVSSFHIRAGYQSKKKLFSGLSQLVLLATLLISGLLLYYGPAAIRDIVILTHWFAGILFFAIFLLHAFIKPSQINQAKQHKIE
jgi:hypothetical protein